MDSFYTKNWLYTEQQYPKYSRQQSDNWSSYTNRVYLTTMTDPPSGITVFENFVHTTYIYKSTISLSRLEIVVYTK